MNFYKVKSYNYYCISSYFMYNMESLLKVKSFNCGKCPKKFKSKKALGVT